MRRGLQETPMGIVEMLAHIHEAGVPSQVSGKVRVHELPRRAHRLHQLIPLGVIPPCAPEAVLLRARPPRHTRVYVRVSVSVCSPVNRLGDGSCGRYVGTRADRPRSCACGQEAGHPALILLVTPAARLCVRW
jgi:hypothetical protein